MGKSLRKVLSVIVMAATIAVLFVSNKTYAMTDIPMYMDFEETVMSINAGESKTMRLNAYYNYTYYIGPHSSAGTYLECSFKSGTQNITFHIGPDETYKNVFFHFYVDDEKVESTDTHDCVEIYVQNIAKTYDSLQVGLKGGKTGSIKKKDFVTIMYDPKDVAMASFSLTLGNGKAATYGIKGIVNNGSNYFDVVSTNNAAPIISSSDKEVMIANGYAGVCVNGVYKNWP